jgi:undecaprenyl diphosphate synthase
MSDTKQPLHIAIIPDGNRRWAKEKGLPTFEGHRRGAENTIKLSRHIRKIGIPTLTFWAFSTENWTRTKDEVQAIFGLHYILSGYVKEAMQDKVRISHLGRRDRLPKDLLNAIEDAEEKTKDNTEYFLNIALDYGGHDEIIRAIQKLTHEELATLTPETFSANLDTALLPHPNPDIIIRTGGEMRMSGFMPWQSTYAEFFFVDKYFPDLSEEDIDQIVEEFANRQRRFGK